MLWSKLLIFCADACWFGSHMHASILTGVHAGRSVGLRSICCGSARAGASHYICQSQGASKRAIINRYKCAELIYIVCVCVCRNYARPCWWRCNSRQRQQKTVALIITPTVHRNLTRTPGARCCVVFKFKKGKGITFYCSREKVLVARTERTQCLAAFSCRQTSEGWG